MVIRIIGVGITVAAACDLADDAQALERLSPAAAGYQDTPKETQIGGACAYFQSPNQCQVVTGEVSVTGWCSLYTGFPLTNLITR